MFCKQCLLEYYFALRSQILASVNSKTQIQSLNRWQTLWYLNFWAVFHFLFLGDCVSYHNSLKWCIINPRNSRTRKDAMCKNGINFSSSSRYQPVEHERKVCCHACLHTWLQIKPDTNLHKIDFTCKFLLETTGICKYLQINSENLKRSTHVRLTKKNQPC